MKPDYWDKATRALAKRDPVLKKLIIAYKGEALTTRGDAFYTLARSIAGQQISVKAADSIWNRIAAAHAITPQGLLSASEEELRAYGLSGQKVSYLRNICTFFNEPGSTEALAALPDEELIAALSSIKGVGRWTAEMMLIFHYQRPDVFPIDDLGVLKAIYRHYNNGEKLDKKSVLALAETWRPYRTVATWYLWRALDPVPVEY